jgi:hypothetical protein
MNYLNIFSGMIMNFLFLAFIIFERIGKVILIDLIMYTVSIIGIILIMTGIFEEKSI